MAEKECWSVGKGRGWGRVGQEEEEETHPGTSTHPGAQSYLPGRHGLQAALTKTLLFNQQIFMEHLQSAKPSGDGVPGSICPTLGLLEAKPSANTASEAEGRHRCRARRTCREE